MDEKYGTFLSTSFIFSVLRACLVNIEDSALLHSFLYIVFLLWILDFASGVPFTQDNININKCFVTDQMILVDKSMS